MAIEKGVNKNAVIQFVVDNWKSLKSARSEKEDKWLQCVQAYHCQHNAAWVAAAKAEDRSHRYIPLIWDAVENVQSQLSELLFPTDDFFRIYPKVPGGDMYDDVFAEDIKVLVKGQHYNMKFKSDVENLLVKQLVMTGNSPWSMTWKIEHAINYPKYLAALKEWLARSRDEWSQFQDNMARYEAQIGYYQQMGLQAPAPPEPPSLYRPEANLEVAWEGPQLEVGNIFNYVQDTHPMIPEAALRINQVFRSKQHLLQYGKKNDRGYSLYENVNKVYEGTTRTGEDFSEEVASAFGLNVPDRDGVDLKTAMGTMEIPPPKGHTGNNKIYKNYIAVVANDMTLLRFEQTPLWSGDLSMKMARLIIVPNQTYGLGLVEPSLDMNEYGQVRANQVIDATRAGINPEYEVVQDGIVDLSEPSGPGKKHLVAQKGNYSAIRKDLSGIPLAMSEYNDIRIFIQQLTRSYNPLPVGGDKTATEIARDTAVSASLLGKITTNIEEGSGGLHDIIDMQIQMSAQYIDEPTMVRTLQKDGNVGWHPIKPEVIRRGWLTKITGSKHAAERNQRLQLLQNGLQIVLSTPIGPHIVDVFELHKLIFKEMALPEGDKLITDTPEKRQIVEQMLMAIATGGRNDQGGEGEGQANGQGTGGQDTAGVLADIIGAIGGPA